MFSPELKWFVYYSGLLHWYWSSTYEVTMRNIGKSSYVNPNKAQQSGDEVHDSCVLIPSIKFMSATINNQPMRPIRYPWQV